jgi:hypothetical protein
MRFQMITRRLALFRIASVSAVATVATAPVAMAAIQPTAPENPTLLRLGRRLSQLNKLCQHRLKAVAAARAAYEAACPPLPEELLVTRYSKDLADSEQETDVDGKLVWPSDPHKPPRRYHAADALQRGLDEWEGYSDREPEEEEIVSYLGVRLRIAKSYEEAVERALEQSGYGRASGAHTLAAYAVENLGRRIAAIPAVTTEGVTIKAMAYEAWANSGGDHADYRASLVIGPGLAKDICRVLSGGEEAA